MPAVFEKYHFLQSLGWGIANSIWQAALLWCIYQIICVLSKNLSPLFKYHLSLLLQCSAFGWFIATCLQNYFSTIEPGAATELSHWLYTSQSVSASLQWLSIGYFAALGIHLFYFIKKLGTVLALQKTQLVKAPVDTRLFIEQTAFRLGIKKRVTVWLSPKTAVPSVIGFIKPMILLPVSALNNLSTVQAEAVLLHELAHIKRNDYVVNLLQTVVETLLFFNPFVKLLGNTARVQRENCCDDWVLNFCYNKQDYSAALLLLEETRPSSFQLAMAATNGKKQLLHRVKRLFAEEPVVQFHIYQKIKLAAISFSVLLVSFFLLPIADKNAAPVEEIFTSALPSVAVATPVQYNENKKYALIIKEEVVQPPKPKPAKKAPAKKQPPAVVTTAAKEVEIKTAFINEELLMRPNEINVLQAANVEPVAAGTMIIKVEEEQSGDKDKRVYFLQLDTSNGTKELKPLILLDKKVKSIYPATYGEGNTIISPAQKKQIPL